MGKMLRTVWDMAVGGVQGGTQESARPLRLAMREAGAEDRQESHQGKELRLER